MVLSMPISVLPLINAERFGNDPRALGLFLAAIAAAGVAAVALIAVTSPGLRRAAAGLPPGPEFITPIEPGEVSPT